jgi:outer membrane protein OmpA-like peptidoglycan-associated protein
MRTQRALFTLAVLGVLVTAGAPARAQNTGRQIYTQQFSIAPDSRGVVTTEGSATLGHLGWTVGAYFNYANDPLVVTRSGDDVFKFVHHQVMADVVVGLGLWHYFGISLHLPVALYQSSSGDETLVGGNVSHLSAGAIGDLRIVPKIRFWKDKGHGFGLALVPAFTVPTGFSHSNFGEQSATFEPRVVLDYRFRQGTHLALNLGARVRKNVTAANLLVGDELLYGLGVEVPVWKRRLSVLGELYGAVGFADAAGDRDKGVDLEEAPLQALLGVRYRFPVGVILTGGAGMGLTDGYGSPDFRVFLGVAFSRPAKVKTVGDRDHDGIPDHLDKCPDDPEDKDGFEDEDGCPDPDNDQDGVCDPNPTIQRRLGAYASVCKGSDGAPDDPEDKDGFEDEDGVPDPDNDKDGVCDSNPTIQGKLEKYAGTCKGSDKAPDAPEDIDGFEDEDGVPDPDNDQDGVCDSNPTIQGKLEEYASKCKGSDKAPDAPEDIDGFEDEDGVPDPDNDQDGFCDPNPTIQQNLARYAGVCKSIDKCPDQPGTQDGCPPKGPTVIDVRKRQIVILEQVNFFYNSPKIMPRSFALLRSVATTLKDNAWIQVVQIEGHTDARGRPDYNLKLSQRRTESVRDFLIKEGIKADRLTAKGFGAGALLDTGCGDLKDRKAREACHEKNRRVVFTILKTQVGKAGEVRNPHR